jgi:hypothetical protein
MFPNKRIDWITYIAYSLAALAAVCMIFWGTLPTNLLLGVILATLIVYIPQQLTTNHAIYKELEKRDEELLKYEILDTDAFYKKLRNITINAKKSIDLMQMQAENPVSSHNKEESNYFESITNQIQDNTKIKIRRLVSIQTKAKLTWVDETIAKNINCSNLNIRYVNVKMLYSKGVYVREKELLPYPVNIQIVDKEHLFIINPVYGYIMSDVESTNIYIHSKKMGAIYSSYYQHYWHNSTILVQQGEINELNLKEIRDEFSN